MFKYRLLSLLSVLLIFVLMLAACGGNGTTGEGAGTQASPTTAAGGGATQAPEASPTEAAAETPAGEATPASEATPAGTPSGGAAGGPTFEQIGGSVSVMAAWGGQEAESFQASIEPFTEMTGVKMNYEVTPELNTVLITRVEAGNPPDIAILPGPNQLSELGETGDLIAVDSFIDMEWFSQNYSQDWIDLGSHNGTLYGVWYKGAVKSLVWYNPKAFEAKGYQVPKSWDELQSLEEKIVSEGVAPWCIGLESGSASGWPGTDWVEDIMLRTAGPETYDQWVNHEISWTDPAVKKAWQTWGEIATKEEMVWGGTVSELTTNFGDAARPLFEDPPGCYLHHQASFITSFFPDGVKAGEDYDFFRFPEINAEHGVPTLGAGDVVIMLRDTPQAQAFMQYVATAQPAEIWAKRGGFISPNRSVDLSAYPDDLARRQAEFLAQAETFRFDGSDLMPSTVGAGSFWRGVLDYVSGSDLDGVLQMIEESAQQAYQR